MGQKPTVADAYADAYARIGVTDEDTDEEALRKAEGLLISRAATYERMGSKMWEAAWQTVVSSGQEMPAIGDIGHAEPAFAALVHSWPPPPPVGEPVRCLVPGCGRGYAVESIARSGRHCTGLEISASAAQLAFEHLMSSGVDAQRWHVEVGDFFSLAPAERFDLIYDATFLCSLPPTQRDAWAKAMRRLLRPGGELVTDVFPVAVYEGGPPFAMSVQLVTSLLEPLGFRAAHAHEVPKAQRARPHFRGASEWCAPRARAKPLDMRMRSYRGTVLHPSRSQRTKLQNASCC